MKPKIKKKWLAALRSGKYKQGKKQLRTNDDCFCCLGVLCDLYVKAHKTKKWKKDIFDEKWGIMDKNMGRVETQVLPHNVQAWAGLAQYNPGIDNVSLAQFNDDGTDFKEIAKLIQENL